MNWILNLLTGSSWDLFVLMGIPCLAVSGLVGALLGIDAIVASYKWKHR